MTSRSIARARTGSTCPAFWAEPMRLIRAADLVAKPWKNGGGVTYDVAVFPEGATLDGFDWRISMAKVETDGPFSAFPGIDRTLTIIEGGGMVLDVDGAEASLAPGEPFVFSGDAKVDARLAAGGILDLNIMTRRGRFTHTVQRVSGGMDIPASGALRFIMAMAPAEIRAGGVSVAAGPRDCVALGPEAGTFSGGPALLVEMTPAR